MNQNSSDQSATFRVLKTSAIFLALIFTLYPIIWLFLLSVKNPVQAFADPPVWFFTPNFSSYKSVFFENNFLQSYINSLIVTIGTLVLGFCIGVPAAYAFSRGRFKHKGKLLNIILISRMAPSLSFVIPFVIIFSRIGLSGSYFGLMLANQTFIMSLIVWLMKTYFDQVTSEIDESAEIDGASAFTIFLRVILPLTTPGLLATLVLCFNRKFFV
jgi:multiple sugar transport system permease protein